MLRIVFLTEGGRKFPVFSSVDQKRMASLLGVNPYFLNEYSIASKNYSLRGVVKIISIIRDYDMYSKGVKIKKATPELLNELISKIVDVN